MQQELIQTPNNAQASTLVRLTLARMMEPIEPQLQAELVGAFDLARAEMSASAARPIERLLAQEAAICWATLQKLRVTHVPRTFTTPRPNLSRDRGAASGTAPRGAGGQRSAGGGQPQAQRGAGWTQNAGDSGTDVNRLA